MSLKSQWVLDRHKIDAICARKADDGALATLRLHPGSIGETVGHMGRRSSGK
jgi:hypothetical protein